jgi:hypothetical protein
VEADGGGKEARRYSMIHDACLSKSFSLSLWLLGVAGGFRGFGFRQVLGKVLENQWVGVVLG